MSHRVLVTGGDGFVGRQVVSTLAGQASTVVRVLLHSPRSVSVVPDEKIGDVAEARSIRDIAEGIDTVIHLAHRIGGSAADLQRTNHLGTANLLRECRRSGVRRVVSLSTAAVYGRTRKVSARPVELAVRPTSATSNSRLLGDELVIATGGLVLRPHLVHGHGDVWFMPRALEITRRIGWIDGGRAPHTVVHVSTLGRAIAELASRPHLPSGAIVVGDEQPMTIKDLLTGASGADPAELPDRELSLAAALGHPAGRAEQRWDDDIRLLGEEHSYDCSPFWSLMRSEA